MIKIDEYLKGFNQLDYPIKLLLIGICLLTPIWFLDIRLFYRHYELEDIYIPIVVSYCLSLALLIANVWLDTCIFPSTKAMTSTPLFMSVIISTSQLLQWTFVAYIFSWKFTRLIELVFISIFCFGVFVNIRRQIRNKKNIQPPIT